MRVKPLRSLLFVPATSPKLLERAHERGADAIILDLEDSIVSERKQEARELSADAARSLVARGVEVLLRVNSDTASCALDLSMAALEVITIVMLPKVESPQQIVWLEKELERLESMQALTNPVCIAALIETPLGVLHAADIARASPRLCALGFGAEDYCTIIGIEPVPAALVGPAQQVILAAHSYGLDCWGLAASIAVTDDMAAFERSVHDAKALGFTGSVAIHPKQVGIINRGFTPSEEQVERARRIVAADEAARNEGLGAVLLDGKMIDRPIVERARRVVSLMSAWRSAGPS
jgi:citrate lyase subunit beta/citryl-CoA lyase